jgi:hypothetical protein
LQELWPKRAERLRWSRNELRDELRTVRRPSFKVSIGSVVVVRFNVDPDRKRRWRDAAAGGVSSRLTNGLPRSPTPPPTTRS